MLRSTVYLASIINNFQLGLFRNSGPFWIKIEILLRILAIIYVYYIQARRVLYFNRRNKTLLITTVVMEVLVAM
jgi:hypothetical protein